MKQSKYEFHFSPEHPSPYQVYVRELDMVINAFQSLDEAQRWVDEMVKSDDYIEHSTYDSEFWGDVKSAVGAETRTEQVGGDHYSKMTIQPIEFINANGLSYMQGNVIKYVCRYRDKNGIEDLEKAKHYIDMMIAELTHERLHD